MENKNIKTNVMNARFDYCKGVNEKYYVQSAPKGGTK